MIRSSPVPVDEITELTLNPTLQKKQGPRRDRYGSVSKRYPHQILAADSGVIGKSPDTDSAIWL